ncbi:DUF58 domain-containing protein [Fulvivirga lutea]|uniref:DUF58 domain-containing protein n=1 Tax=Fulvivirga lutea TaxID=2810512 RepID=A0A975A013_9BACT|nr:DUF58 domain-containing protein [Fulvivirga lutea]QSE96894.1 DUF58 domain-containing protein [Fulvivirga lutea]
MKLELAKIREVGDLNILARQLVEGFVTGLHKSPYHGFSVEFSEHRLYNTGESTKHIDWKVFAKTDRLYTKRFEEETNLRCLIVLDDSSSMHYPVESKAKIQFSIIAAASLAYLLQKQRDAVGICTFSNEIELITEQKSTSTHLNKILSELQNLYDNPSDLKKTQTAKVLHEIAGKTPRRSLIILFTDMFDSEENLDEIFSGLQHLKHNKHEVLLFHVTDKKTEFNFEFEDRPHEFIDLESGEKIKLQPSEVKDHFKKSAAEFYQNLKLKCAQMKIDLIEADVEIDYNEILKAYLIKRSKMR